MEISTIIGIVIAIVICCIGLFMILRKPSDAAPSLDAELHINEQCNQPVIPRHVRSLLQAQAAPLASSERVEPSLKDIEASEVAQLDQTAVQQATKTPENIQETVEVVDTVQLNTSVDLAEKESKSLLDSSKNTDSTETDPLEKNTETIESKAQSIDGVTDTQSADLISKDSIVEITIEDSKKVEPSFVLNPNIQTAEIKEFEEESSILDVHLHEQQRFDDESALANAEYIISLNMYPNPRKALSGDKALKVLMKYGLRFGEMNCFHRYETPDAVSPLLFSVLRITDQGPAGFDLETLSGEQVQGLAFFLALPHHNVQKGYDSMVSIAGLIARETDGTVYDENNLEFTPQLKEHWRHKAIDYRSGQAV